MLQSDYLGNNIKHLRNSYGETQEQLGEIVGVNSNTISQYEHNKRVPDKDTIKAIATHYMVTVDELLKSDLTTRDFSQMLSGKDFINNLHKWFFIFKNDIALTNDTFRKAIDIHYSIFKNIQSGQIEAFNDINKCIDLYKKAFSDPRCKYESAANYIGLWIFYSSMLKGTIYAISDCPVIISKFLENDIKLFVEFEDEKSDVLKEIETIVNNDSFINNSYLLYNYLATLKKSLDWSELADYYLCLLYFSGSVDNSLDIEQNRIVGGEMLTSFLRTGNQYIEKLND